MPKKDADNGNAGVLPRISSGVKGLDEFLGGGFVPGSVILVSGKTGTGKTLFSSNFIMEGLRNGERCMYLTTEEPIEKIKKDVLLSFGWDFDKYVKSGLLQMRDITPYDLAVAQSSVQQIAREKVTRVVLDSTSMFELYLEDTKKMREMLFDLVKMLRKNNITAMFTAEIPEESKGLSRAGVVEFIVDAIILLEYFSITEKYRRALLIRKMRTSDHSKDRLPYEITKGGIRVFSPKVIGKDYSS